MEGIEDLSVASFISIDRETQHTDHIKTYRFIVSNHRDCYFYSVHRATKCKKSILKFTLSLIITFANFPELWLQEEMNTFTQPKHTATIRLDCFWLAFCTQSLMRVQSVWNFVHKIENTIEISEWP